MSARQVTASSATDTVAASKLKTSKIDADSPGAGNIFWHKPDKLLDVGTGCSDRFKNDATGFT